MASRGTRVGSEAAPSMPGDPARTAARDPSVVEPTPISVPEARGRLNGFLAGLPPLNTVALADRAIQEIAKVCRKSPSFLQAAIEALQAGVSSRDWMILVVALGRVEDPSAEETLLELYQRERNPLRKGFLATGLMQLKDPEGLSKAYGDEFLLSLGLEGSGSAKDLRALLPRLIAGPEMRPSLRVLLLSDFSSTDDDDLARGLAFALRAAVGNDPEVRKIMLSRALGNDLSSVSSDLASIIAEAAMGRPQDSDLISDALQLLESGPTEAVRDAAAIRLARSEDPVTSARLTGLLMNAQAPASTRLRILSGMAAQGSSWEHPSAQAIVSLAERSSDPLVRRRAIAALGSIRNWPEESRVAFHSRLLADSDPEIRIETIRSIARLELRAGYPAVEQMAKTDSSATVRQVASEATAPHPE